MKFRFAFCCLALTALSACAPSTAVKPEPRGMDNTLHQHDAAAGKDCGSMHGKEHKEEMMKKMDEGMKKKMQLKMEPQCKDAATAKPAAAAEHGATGGHQH